MTPAGEREKGKPQANAPKKPFVEPEVSLPIDVLGATTFFGTVQSAGVKAPPPVGGGSKANIKRPGK